MKKNILMLLALSLICVVVNAQKTVIKDVNVIDVKSGKVDKKSVVISGESIERVDVFNKLKTTNNDVIIDGANKYLLPGLIDSHIHFFQSGSLYTRPDVIDLRKNVPYEKEVKFGIDNTTDYLKRYLRLGITTIIDVGGPFTNFIIRDSVSKTIVSPNILVTGPLFSIVDRPQLGAEDAPIIKVTNEKEVDSLFYKMLPYKPDFIKIWYIAGKKYPAEQSFPLVKYIGQLATKSNLKLAVHATELKTARFAVDAGANILVHSIDDEIIPDDFIKVLKAKNVTYIPTLLVSSNYSYAFAGTLPHHYQDLSWANAFAYGTMFDFEKMNESELSPFIKKIRKEGIPKAWNKYDSISAINLGKLVKAKVNVATGTDAGNIGTFHASSYIQELEGMSRTGVSNADILKASTINAAAGFGLEKRLGSIEKGKTADLLLLSKNPLESLDNLNTIEYIFKNGRMIKADTVVSESPEAIVQKQVNAYNARDIDAFLATYSDDVQIVNSDGEMRSNGKEQMKQGYENLFKNTPNLYCEIQNRIVINNKVIDKEKVRFNNKTIQGVAIYEVEYGKIKKVTFVW